MIKRLSLIAAAVLVMFSSTVKADEGMWLLPLLKQFNEAKMQEMGLELSAEDIYSINNTSLKDAIVIFGRGCTGEVISDQGLVLTNHHCGYGAIQQHSKPGANYLQDGFWAETLKDEIPTPGLTITFLVRIDDVTSRVEAALDANMSETDRAKAAWAESDKIAKEATEGTHYSARVQSFYGGNKYYLMVYETFRDIRMVGAPPSSIGKFGADTDNWMWPRHTGDFSMFRIYASKDNKPAEYSTENVPYKPKHHLPISLKGVEQGDFSMIMGYPGSTQRYMTSWEVDELIKISNANRIYIRGIRQDILLEDMLADEAVRIKYASKYAGSSNYWKNSIGMNKALKRLKIYDKKKVQEADYTNWVNADPSRKAKYGEALTLIQQSVEKRAALQHVTQYMAETMLRGTELVGFAANAAQLEKALKEKNNDEVAKQVENLKRRATGFYKDYNAPTDRKVGKAMFKIFAQNVDKAYYPEVFATIESKYKNDYAKYIDDMFNKSIFTDEQKLNKFLEKPNLKTLEKDPAYVAGTSIYKKYNELYAQLAPLNADFDKGHRLFIAGTIEKNDGKAMYPDANFTMRLTYGQIKDYYPMDAVHYDYITTLDGVMEKEDPDNWEFVVPAKLKELYKNKDFGQYALPNGKMPVAFISTNDITGGNSGSPVINGKGELIGTAFDGNWEAMSGDIVFEPELQRTISVDIRYTLFIVEKYAGAKRLIDEMTIIK
ncbi:MAG TPA: S46 family peptidase [Tenuifilaceae bacterium]|nr:S46 family peptidase [Tenuifilaceae bacterium]HQB77122.1 S46 family peptidase [Tenuifilaceae bacterium]